MIAKPGSGVAAELLKQMRDGKVTVLDMRPADEFASAICPAP